MRKALLPLFVKVEEITDLHWIYEDSEIRRVELQTHEDYP